MTLIPSWLKLSLHDLPCFFICLHWVSKFVRLCAMNPPEISCCRLSAHEWLGCFTAGLGKRFRSKTSWHHDFGDRKLARLRIPWTQSWGSCLYDAVKDSNPIFAHSLGMPRFGPCRDNYLGPDVCLCMSLRMQEANGNLSCPGAKKWIL